MYRYTVGVNHIFPIFNYNSVQETFYRFFLPVLYSPFDIHLHSNKINTSLRFYGRRPTSSPQLTTQCTYNNIIGFYL